MRRTLVRCRARLGWELIAQGYSRESKRTAQTDPTLKVQNLKSSGDRASGLVAE